LFLEGRKFAKENAKNTGTTNESSDDTDEDSFKIHDSELARLHHKDDVHQEIEDGTK
jgi:hypothetical protein